MELVMNGMEELNEQEMMMIDGGGFWGSFTSGFVGGAITGATTFSASGPVGAAAGAVACGVWCGGIAAFTSSTIYNF